MEQEISSQLESISFCLVVNLSDEEGSAEVDTKDESLHADESHTRLLQSDDDDEEDSLDSMDDYSSHSSHDDTNEISLNHEEVTDNNLSSPTGVFQLE